MPQCKWEQPELSVGSPCASLDILGRYKCWVVKDRSPAHVVWKAVSKPIISLLDDQFEHLDAGDSDLIFEMFMVGRKPTSTVPTIIFSCESKSCRQKAMALVQKKSILAAHPGVHMAECSRLPKLLTQEEDPESLFLPAGVYLDGPLRTCGTPVLISFGPKRLPRKATIGGIVCIDETLYGVTAGHAFTPPKKTVSSDMDDIEFSFFGGDDPFDSSEDEDESVEMTSQASMSSGSSQSPSTNDFEFGGRRRKSITSSLSSGSTQKSTATRRSMMHEDPAIEGAPERYGTLFTFSDADESLDWALVKIENPILLRFPRTNEYMANNMKLGNKIIHPNSIASGSSDADVVVCTGSRGVVEGRLSGVAAYKRAAGQKEFQQLSTVTLSVGTFNDGDCGSWVCDLRTGAVYGHVVSGYSGTGSAYIVPSDHIFKDMVRTLEKSVRLLTRTLAARNAALSIWGHIDADTVQSTTSETHSSTSDILPMPFDPIPEAVHDGPVEDVGNQTSDLVKAMKARPAFVEDADEEGEAIPDTRRIASRIEAPRPTSPPFTTGSSFEDITSDSGYSSGRLTANSYDSASADQPRGSNLEASNKKVEHSPPVLPRTSSVSQQRKVGGKTDNKIHQRKLPQLTAKKPRRSERLSSSQPSKTDQRPSESSGRIVPGNIGNVTPRPTSNTPPMMNPVMHYGSRAMSPIISQAIPLRPRVISLMATRPMSFYGQRDSGYLSGLPQATVPPYPPPQTFSGQLSYPPPPSYSFQPPGFYLDQYQLPPQNSTGYPPIPVAGQIYDNFSPQSRPLSARFAPPVPITREPRYSQNDSDDEYISATELIGPQNISVPPRPNSATGIRGYGTVPPLLRRTGSQAELSDRQAMPPPPRPTVSQQRGQYDISSSQRPQVRRRSVSYDTGRGTDVRIEPAVSSSLRHRRQNYYGDQRPTDPGYYNEKMRQAASYQQDVAGAPSAALTTDSLKKTGRYQASGSRDTRSTRSSADTQSTRSSHHTRSRNSSASSASSLTSRDEDSYKKSTSTRTRNDPYNDEDVTIKISSGARVTVGGTQFDCNDGGEIVINRVSSVLEADQSDARMNYDYPRTETLRRRFDRSTSATEDGKSDLSIRSATSDDTVKGKGKVKFDSPSGQTTPSISLAGNQGVDMKSTRDNREHKRPVEIVAEPAARERDRATKKRAKVRARRCGTCFSSGRDVWVTADKVCPVCGTPC
ncbi:hypothetical protein BKA64DRAFT_715305 [Cadophora sp. MPI-SDFR-AT-0126]|nr:hypothetical protein BKA64DRAFT_715305 [Leotiomycetes sp. MPI-SDFR-AT-0126]